MIIVLVCLGLVAFSLLFVAVLFANYNEGEAEYRELEKRLMNMALTRGRK